MTIVDATDWPPAAWDGIATRSQMGEAFQSHAWGELKRSLGWTPLRYVIELNDRRVAAVFVQERQLRRVPSVGRLTILYAPRGPVALATDAEAVAGALEGMRLIAQRRNALVLTIDPTWQEGTDLAAALGRGGFRPARRDIQVSRTAMLVPLHTEEPAQRALLGHTTAYDLNKARKAGVTVERIDMLDAATRDPALEEFFEMHAATGRREGFLVRDRGYQLEQWRSLGQADVAGLWFSGVGGLRQTGALVLRCGARLVYYAAGSLDDADLHRTRANHLLQWNIIRWAAENGFEAYDMGGVDTHDAPGLPGDASHPLWNLFLFKSRFGAQGVLFVRAHEYAPRRAVGLVWRLVRRIR